MCVSPRYLVFHSLAHHHVLHYDQLRLNTSSGDRARPSTADNRRCGAEGYRSVRLSVGQALPVSRYAFLLYFSASRGWPLPDNKWTPAVSFFLDTQASGSTSQDHIRLRFLTCTDFLCENFLEKAREFSWKLLRVILFMENSMKFLRKFEQEFSRKFRDPFLPPKFLP